MIGNNDDDDEVEVEAYADDARRRGGQSGGRHLAHARRTATLRVAAAMQPAGPAPHAANPGAPRFPCSTRSGNIASNCGFFSW